jgi:hypothetical protein
MKCALIFKQNSSRMVEDFLYFLFFIDKHAYSKLHDYFNLRKTTFSVVKNPNLE